MLDDTTLSTRHTSAEAFGKVGIRRLKWIQDELESICLAAHACGLPDLSLREIQCRYEETHQRRIEMSTVSSRINALVTSTRLVRDGVCRLCSITGRTISPVRVARASDQKVKS